MEAQSAPREYYVTAARQLLGPLLRAYNRENATRLRLKVERLRDKQPALSTRTLELFNRFAVLANTSSLHPLDWKRFYLLVREGRQKVPEERIRTMLSEAGFSYEKASFLAEIYSHLWAFKRLK